MGAQWEYDNDCPGDDGCPCTSCRYDKCNDAHAEKCSRYQAWEKAEDEYRNGKQEDDDDD